jgi:hypothetical protein
MRGRNVKCRLEQPLDTKTGTGGRTRKWPNLPDFGGSLTPLSSAEQDFWERDVEDASFRLLVTGRAIPAEHHDKVAFKNRVVVTNRRNNLSEQVYDIIGVNPTYRAGRLRQFEIILGNIT